MRELDHDIPHWVAVSGATGFIGRALCEALLKQGYGVIALSRDPLRAKRQLAGLDQRRTVFCGYQQLEEIAPTALINLAGANIAEKRWGEARKKRLLDSRLETSRLLMAATSHWQTCLKLVISGSAVGYYGNRGEELLEEDSGAGEDFAAQLCQQWEHCIPRAAHYRRIIIRLGIVLGPTEDGGALAAMKLPFQLGLGAQFGAGQHWQPWISRQDVIRAILFLMDQPLLQGEFNLVAPAPVRNRDFTQTLAATLGRPAFLRIPRRAAQLLFGEMSSLLLASQRAVPSALQGAGFEFEHSELATAMAWALNKT